MCAFRRVGVDVMPAAILQRHCKDVRYRMIQRLAAGAGIVLLRIVRAATNYRVGVMASVNDDALYR